MAKISVTARTGAPEETSADTRVIGLFDGETPPGSLGSLSEADRATARLIYALPAGSLR